MAQKRRTPEIIAGMVASDGSLSRASAEGVVPGRSAVGQFSVTFPAGFRLLSFVCTGTGSVGVCRIDTLTDRTVTMTWVTPNTVAAIDVNFTFVAVGFQQ